MSRLARLPLLTALALLPASLVAACGDDDPAPGGAGGAGGSGGADPGPFGTRVPVSETSDELTGLTGPVNVVRDRHGMVHIYARNVEDAFRTQGWMMASDRHVQMEILRRASTGRLSALLGGADRGTIDQDISIRTIGIPQVAQQMYDALAPGSEGKRIIDAYSDGISQYFAALREGRKTLPFNYTGMRPEVFGEWTPIDSLALARIQTLQLSYDGSDDVGNTDRMQAIRDAFPATSTDPAVARRAGILRDLIRWAPADPAVHQDGFPNDAPLPQWIGGPGLTPVSPVSGAARVGAPGTAAAPRTVRASRALLRSFDGFAAALERTRALFGADEHSGSNNWAVAASESESGHALVANDPHLGLDSPMVFWPVHLAVESETDPTENLEVAGLAFAGIPGVILGTNPYLAWAATTAAFDVTDAWRETVTADGSGVTFRGQTVPFTRRSETIDIAGGRTYTWEVLSVPHHGPVAPTLVDHEVQPVTATTGAISIRWTGHEPTEEFEAVHRLWRAQTVDQARAALSIFGTGAQNWTVADRAGDILTYSPARLPYRDKRAFTWDPATYEGVTPNMLLDGESGEHEWTGEYLEEIYIPKVRTPASGWVATANGDHIGTTLDNDPTNELTPGGQPFYLQGDYDLGFRIGRIQQRLTELTAGAEKASAAEMAELQGDHRSALGSRLTEALLTAIAAAEAERLTPGTHADLSAVVADARYDATRIADVVDALTRWRDDFDYRAASGVNPADGSLVAAEERASTATAYFNAWFIRAVARTLGDECARWGASDVGTAPTAKAFVRLVTADPTTLATYDAATGDSALWDDLGTASVEESRQERMIVALLDGLEALDAAFGTADRSTWAWGNLHRVTFDALVPLWPISIPGSSDALFPEGFPRHGDQWAVDVGNYDVTRRVEEALGFSYGSGPVQRFVAELTPDGPIVHNALPGGAQIWPESPFYRNEADLWYRNESHVVPFTKDEVTAEAVAPGGAHILFR